MTSDSLRSRCQHTQQGKQTYFLQYIYANFACSVKESLSIFEQRTGEATTSAQKLALSVQKELQVMTRHAPTNSVLQEQVTEHREAKASVTEQLNMARIQLTQAQCEVSNLRQREQEQSQAVQSLQAEVSQIRKQPTDATAIMLRLHDVETLNRDLQVQKTAAERDTQLVNQKLQQKERETNNLVDQLSGLQLKLEESQGHQEALRNERASFENHIKIQRAAEEAKVRKTEKDCFEQLKRDYENEARKLEVQLQKAEQEIQRLTTLQQNTASHNTDDLAVLAEAKEEATRAKEALYDEVSIDRIHNEL